MLKEKDVLKVKQAMLDSNIDNDKVEAVVAKLLPEPEEEIEDKEPREKKQYVVVVSDPEGMIKTDLVGWVVQIPETDGPHLVLDKVREVAKSFNQSKKGSKYPVKNVVQTFEAVPYRFQKESKIGFKTKEPVLIVTTDGRL